MTKQYADNFDREIAQRIRKFRKQAGLSQIDISRKCGVSYQQLQKYETGVNRVSASRIKQLSDALGVTINQLFGITE